MGSGSVCCGMSFDGDGWERLSGHRAPAESPLPPAPSPASRREGENCDGHCSGNRNCNGNGARCAGPLTPDPSPANCAGEGRPSNAQAATVHHIVRLKAGVPHGAPPHRICRRRPTSRCHCRDFNSIAGDGGAPIRTAPIPHREPTGGVQPSPAAPDRTGPVGAGRHHVFVAAISIAGDGCTPHPRNPDLRLHGRLGYDAAATPPGPPRRPPRLPPPSPCRASSTTRWR
jgi:hypothetical protein